MLKEDPSESPGQLRQICTSLILHVNEHVVRASCAGGAQERRTRACCEDDDEGSFAVCGNETREADQCIASDGTCSHVPMASLHGVLILSFSCIHTRAPCVSRSYRSSSNVA